MTWNLAVRWYRGADAVVAHDPRTMLQTDESPRAASDIVHRVWVWVWMSLAEVAFVI
jgi:hypothetical protein